MWLAAGQSCSFAREKTLRFFGEFFKLFNGTIRALIMLPGRLLQKVQSSQLQSTWVSCYYCDCTLTLYDRMGEYVLNALDYSVEMIWLLSPGLQANCSHWLQWCALPFNLGAPNSLIQLLNTLKLTLTGLKVWIQKLLFFIEITARTTKNVKKTNVNI